MFESMVSTAGLVPAGLSSTVLADLISTNHEALLAHETRVLVLAAAWADAHDLDPTRTDYQPLVERACVWGGDGTPAVSEYCAVELGALQGTGSVAARQLIADALDLRHRLPRLWVQVQAGHVRAWQARKVAEATRALTWEAAGEVDDTVSGYLAMMPWGRFQAILTAAILQADPAMAREREERTRTTRDVWATDTDDGLRTLIARAGSGDVAWFLAATNRIADLLAADGDTDPVGARRAKAIGILAHPDRALQLLRDHQHDVDPTNQPEPDEPDQPDGEGSSGIDLTGPAVPVLRPKVVLHLHLTDHALETGAGLVRPEHGTALTLTQLHAFLADTGCRIQVRPVLDPAVTAPVDAYEIPNRLRAAVRLRHVTDVFPYGTSTSAHLDLDHTTPWDPGGPPGQTGLANLGPLTRTHHRAVTHGRWSRRQPHPGVYTYRSPTGYVFLVTNHGTLNLGRTPFAHQVWNAAQTRVDTAAA